MLDFGSGPHARHDGLLCYLSICPAYCTSFVSRRDANGHWPILKSNLLKQIYVVM